MEKLVSSVELKKSDGKPITFNFQFANGLPMKPIYEMPTELWISRKTGRYGLTIKLDISIDINNFSLESVSFHNTAKESKDIWIHLLECYFIVKNVKNIIVQKMENQGIGIIFVDEGGNQL